MRADVGKARLNFGDAMRITRVFRFREQRGALAVGFEHDIDKAFGTVRRFLREAADAPARRQFNRALLGRKLAGDHVKERRLAGAVAADQTDARAGRHARRGVFDERAAGNANGDVVDDEHLI